MDTLKVLANKKMLLSFETRIRELQDMEVTEMTFVDIFEEELKRREAESNAESEAKGRAEGEAKGMAKQLLSLVNQNIITKEIAAAQFGGTFAELEAAANK